MEKVSRRMQQLETVSNNIKLLTEMLNYVQTNKAQESEQEVMKVRGQGPVYREILSPPMI